MRGGLDELVRPLPAAFGGSGEIEHRPGYPPLVNDPEITRLVAEVAGEVVPSVVDCHTMGGEDFAFFLRQVPGCYFFLGARNPDKACEYPHHHPRFDVDEDALALGVELFVRIAERFLGASPRRP